MVIQKEIPMKILTAAALALLLTAGMSYAQTTGGGASTGGSTSPDNTMSSEGGGDDAADYLTGPNIHKFYTDNSMGTMRSEAEMKSAYGAMSESDRAKLKSACASNNNPKHADFCKSINAM